MGHLWNPARFTLGNLKRNLGSWSQNQDEAVLEHPYAVILLNRSDVGRDLESKVLEHGKWVNCDPF